MTAGCDNFKTSSLTRHAASADHQKAIIAPKERSNLSTSVLKNPNLVFPPPSKISSY
jgi:hypothetical protein